MMYKKILIVLLFVLITSPVFSAGSSGGSSGGDAKPVTQYEIALKMINKAFENKQKTGNFKVLTITPQKEEMIQKKRYRKKIPKHYKKTLKTVFLNKKKSTIKKSSRKKISRKKSSKKKNSS